LMIAASASLFSICDGNLTAINFIYDIVP